MWYNSFGAFGQRKRGGGGERKKKKRALFLKIRKC